MSKPLVSIAMATYNGASFLPMMLESIITQTYTNLEIVIVDDASTDNTKEILTKFAQSDSRIKLSFSEKNQGAIKTFEKALGLAKGEFIALADQDDTFRKDKIELQLERMIASPSADIVLSDLCLVGDSGEVIAESMWRHQRLSVREGKPFEQLLYANFVTGCATMIRRRLLEGAFPFPENCIMHDWWLSVLSTRSACGGIALIPQSLTFYRQHSSNVIGAHSGGLLASIKRVPLLSERCAWYAKNKARLEAYLSDHEDMWSKEDLESMRRMARLFTCMSQDDSNSFTCRINSLYSRLSYARYYGWVHAAGILVFCFVPKLADFVKRV
ncbi:MAG: glycosyltransferase family 2 protein [Gallionella sp.]